MSTPNQMNTLDQIQALQRQLRDVRSFRSMRERPNSPATVHNKSLSFELGWQAHPGSIKYHATTEFGLGEILAEAFAVDDVLVRAEELLTNRIAKLRLSREQELRAELDEIEKLKFTVS